MTVAVDAADNEESRSLLCEDCAPDSAATAAPPEPGVEQAQPAHDVLIQLSRRLSRAADSDEALLLRVASERSDAEPQRPPPKAPHVAVRVAHAAALRATRRVRFRRARAALASQAVRAPVQMAVALTAACLLATSPRSSAAFHHKGEWIAITVALALEANVGATSRKAALRALGTCVGGVLGGFVLVVTVLVSGGSVATRVATLTALVAALGSGVQALRVRDSKRDYAYSMTLVTLVLTSVSGAKSTEASLGAALESVGLRIATIALGGALALAVSGVVLPEMASAAARATLKRVLRDAAALLGAVVDEYTREGDATTPRLGATAVAGFADGRGPDGGLVAAHAALHSLEARVARDLERYATLLAQAAEETLAARLLRRPPLPPAPFAAAGVAARALFTGAVALLHGMESGLHLCALCMAHAPAIGAARSALHVALADVAELAGSPVARHSAARRARASLAAFEAAVEALADDVSRESAWPLLATGGADAGADVALRHNVQALGAVCFALGDAARQAAVVLHALDPGSADEGDKAAPGGSLRAGPGGALLARGGGGMGAALRNAAHALDAALHGHLAATHARAPPRQSIAPSRRAFSWSNLVELG